jgi:hypothetical protein
MRSKFWKTVGRVEEVTEFVELSSGMSCSDPEIGERARVSPKSKITTQYRVVRDEKEIAFVAIDRIPQIGVMVLYELFVPARLRGAGLGPSIVHEVERMARGEGYHTVTLTASPLEQNFSRKRLEAWYRRLGYRTRRGGAGELEKGL